MKFKIGTPLLLTILLIGTQAKAQEGFINGEKALTVQQIDSIYSAASASLDSLYQDSRPSISLKERMAHSTSDSIIVFEKLSQLTLPPVSVFLEAANTYADVRYFDKRITEEKENLKLIKKDWLNYFRIQGSYQFGTNYGLTTQTGEPNSNGYGIYSQRTQSYYNIGVGLFIPLDDLFSRGQKTRIVKARVNQIEYEAEKALENRQIIILQAYNEVVKHLSTIKVKAEAVALYDAQMKISETNFINGRIDIISLSLERSRRATAQVTLQESRAALLNAVSLLEMLTKIKIINE